MRRCGCKPQLDAPKNSDKTTIKVMPNNPNAADNLVPFPPGVSGNPNGRPEGRRSLSTIIKDILENEIDWDLVPIKNAKDMAEKYKGKKAWEALVYAAYSQAIAGNVKAATWLSKSGYGSKIDIESGGKPIKAVSIFDLKEANDNDGTTDGNDNQSEASEPSGSDQEPSV